MALTPVGIDHNIGGVIHVQIMHDSSSTHPADGFSARINAPGLTKDLPLRNGSTIEFAVPAGPLPGTVRAEVDDFRLLPAGATDGAATAIACKVVFKLIAIAHVTLGSVDVTAALAPALAQA